MKPNNISTYYKILLLNTLSSIAFILLFLFLYHYTTKQEKQVYKSSIEQFNNEVKSLLLLNSESHISTITDITYWDELVKFISTKNIKWYQETIGSAIAVYNVDYLAVYDLEGNPIVSTTTGKIKSTHFIPKELMPDLYKSKLNKFYMKVPEGVVEVFGATIHPSNDPLKNKSKPSGYFFMARLLDPSYFQDLEKISSSQINFTDNHDIKSVHKDSIFVTVDLMNWDKTMVTKLLFKRHFNVNFKNTKNILNIIIAAFIINLIIMLIFSRRWVYTPLLLITKVLETENKKAITSLRKLSGEFGHIGNLFYENLNQRKLLEKAKVKAEESDKLKSSFLTNLSHEIRTPMNAIIGFSDLLNNRSLDDTEKQSYLEVIIQSGNNLVSIIDDLIEMSKIDAQQITPNYSSVNLEACLKELHKTIKVTIPKEKKIEFTLESSFNPLTKRILTDEIKLKQIIVNLLTNAIKFTDEGTVSFGYEVNATDSMIQFTIKDSGLGIDEEHHKIIFDRFRRIDGDYSIKVGGLGLGLAISKAYVEMLGGQISLESKVDVGSVFTFTIPLIYDDKTVPSSLKLISDSQFDTKGNETILIAEDDNINYLLLEKIMSLKKYKIIRAVDGLEAVEICKNNNDIDLVLMDIKMPKLNGYEALEQIKKMRPELSIIAQTAYSSSDDIEKIKQAGFAGYITKPLNKEKLFELIHGFL